MTATNADTEHRRESERLGPESVDTRLVSLIVVTTLFGAGHHVDHVVRGNHVGWPLIPEVTVFTYTLAVYPFIAVGLYLTVTERVGANYWSVLFGTVLLLVTVTHFGPWATEPPQDVIGPYESATLGYAAFAWLLGFVGSLLVATVYAIHRWRWARRRSMGDGRTDPGDDGSDDDGSADNGSADDGAADGASADAETDESGTLAFSLLDASVNYAHGHSDSKAVSELQKTSERAEELEEAKRERR